MVPHPEHRSVDRYLRVQFILAERADDFTVSVHVQENEVQDVRDKGRVPGALAIERLPLQTLQLMVGPV
jgi:hypothetical protein